MSARFSCGARPGRFPARRDGRDGPWTFARTSQDTAAAMAYSGGANPFVLRTLARHLVADQPEHIMFSRATHSPPDDWVDIREPAGPSLAVLENAFRRWVTGTGHADLMHVHRDLDVPLAPVLEQLRASTRPLLPADAGILGLPDHASLGDAATQLLRAHIDPGGPRCRSLRSAVWYLQGLGRLDDVEGPAPAWSTEVMARIRRPGPMIHAI